MPFISFTNCLLFFIIATGCFTISAASDDLSHRNQTSRTLTTSTVCAFPAFLKVALGIVCTQKEVKTTDHFYYAPVAEPVVIKRAQNETCKDGRYEWTSSNSSLCCLELPCTPGQVLAKDARNTVDGECPKCRNAVFEYICDPLNDTCSRLQNGSVCRKFFNSSDIFICGCDARNGYTQNRMAFPAACTKTIGAVCFFQEHCKFVDPNSRCDIKSDVKPPRGTCQCKKGFTEDGDGRCVERIRQVRQAVADWGDKSIWADGPLTKYPMYDFPPSSRKISPVLVQLFNPGVAEDISSAQRIVRAVNTSSDSTTPQTAKPQPYMIAAQHMVPNTSSASQIKVVGRTLVSSPSPTTDASKISSSNAVSGTKFAADDGTDSQLDSVLNIVRPVKRKLQTDRPVTAKTWDATPSPTSGNMQSSTINAVTIPQTLTNPPNTTPAVREVFFTAARFTRPPATATVTTATFSRPIKEGFLTGVALQEAFGLGQPATAQSTITTAKSTSTVAVTLPTSTTTQTAIPSTTRAPSTTTSATTMTVSTTSPTTTTRTTTVPVTSTSQSTTVPTTTTQSSTTAAQRISEATTSVPSMGDADDTIILDNTEGIIKVQFGDSPRRFGGIVRVPAHAVIGGVSRPLQPQGTSSDSSNSLNVRSDPALVLPQKTSTTLALRDPPSTTTTATTLFTFSTTAKSVPPAATTKADVFEHHGVDFSFLQDSRLSKADMQKRLLQALLELSATTTTTTSTTTTTPSTTTKSALDLSFLSDPTLSAADIQMRLLPLLMQLNSQQTAPPPPTTTDFSAVPAQSSPSGVPADIAAAMAQLRQLQAAEQTSTTRQLYRRGRPTTTTSTVAPVPIDDDSAFNSDGVTTTTARTRSTRKRTMSFFGALLNGFGSMSPRRPHESTPSAADDDQIVTQTTSAPTTTAPTTLPPTRRKSGPRNRTSSQFGQMDDVLDATGLPVPSFTDVFTGLGSLFGTTLFGSKGARPAAASGGDDYSDNVVPSGRRPIGYKPNNGGKIDLTSERGQAAFAEKIKKMGGLDASSSYGGNGGYGDYSQKQNGNPNSKFNFDNPSEQVQFVKFLQNFDKYQPASTQQGQQQPPGGSPLFPQPPPRRPEVTEPLPTAAPFVPPPAPAPMNPVLPADAPGNAIALPVDSLSPETWDLINKMQKPGYYNVTPEQMEALRPLLDQIKAHSPLNIPATPPPTTVPPQPPQPQYLPRPAEIGGLFGGGDPYSPFGSLPPVPPLLPQPLPTDSPGFAPPPPTAPPTAPATTTTTTTSTTNTPPKGEAKSLFPVPDGGGFQQVVSPVVKMPSQPPFKDVIDKHDCPTNCQQDDSNQFCDTRIGVCVCKPGYHSSFLEGNVCTKTIFSLCSGDEDCQSGGDLNAVCAFNGQNRFCTCSNGYLPDQDGSCKPMFAERCSGICNIPNAVCDQFQKICRCPTGYAWFKDPWTGQPVCRAALGGAVPCRSDQDLCPIYTPRGRCRNNAFCGCDDGYIPDSWFTNQSERTSCIDVLSAKCDDSSDCTVADRNTICDRRLRMCACKPGYKPDQFHNSACIVAV